MTAAQDLADVLSEVADHHDPDCPDRAFWEERATAPAVATPEVSR